MKKIMLCMWCCLILTGCQKKIDVVVKTDGFQIEKIASFPADEETDIMLDTCKKDTLCLENYKNKIVYELDLNNNSVKELRIPENNNHNPEIYSVYPIEDGFVAETILLISDSEKIIQRRETQNQSVKKSMIYKTNQEEIVLNQTEINKEDEFELPEYFMMLNDRSVYTTYVEHESLVAKQIEAGGKITEIARVPLVEDGMKLTQYQLFGDEMNLNFPFDLFEVLPQNYLIYENETTRRIHLGEEIFETALNENYYLIKENIVLLQEKDPIKDNIIKTTILHLDTQEKIECSESLNGFIFPQVEWGEKVSKQFIFKPYDNLTTDKSQFTMVGKFEENQLQLIELPFETDQYFFEIIDENRYAFVSNGKKGKTFDLYIVELE